MSTTRTEEQQQPDKWIPASEISSELREMTGDPGPGRRLLLELAANGRLSMMTRRNGRWWGVYQSKLPALAQAVIELTVQRAS